MSIASMIAILALLISLVSIVLVILLAYEMHALERKFYNLYLNSRREAKRKGQS